MIVAAYPGFIRLSYYKTDKGETCVDEDPIVAWSIDDNGRDEVAYPICLIEPSSGALDGVLQPNGRVVSAIAVYESRDAWVAGMQEFAAQLARNSITR